MRPSRFKSNETLKAGLHPTMDIEFHYYMTWLIAARAGFGPEDARTVAYASQYTDDNDRVFEIDKGLPTAYGNYVSQTMNILNPVAKLFRIYPLFHFIPGDPFIASTWRKDGAMHWLNTTPGSENADLVMDAALASGDLYRIGVACHGYADTWAHQNFIGYHNEFNSMTGPLSFAVPNIGHAEAGHNPDWVALVWQDSRLIHERVDNRARFLDAAGAMFKKLAGFVDPKMTERTLLGRQKTLKKDLDRCIGEPDSDNDLKGRRIERYQELALSRPYGGRAIDPYDENEWMDEAVDVKVRGLRDRSDLFIARWDPLRDVNRWKDRKTYKQTSWYRFQEAVKAHQNGTWQILEHKNFLGLDLPKL